VFNHHDAELQIHHSSLIALLTMPARAILGFLRKDTPEKWKNLLDAVTDNFRIIDPDKFRVLI
jgi:hypothetical protein